MGSNSNAEEEFSYYCCIPLVEMNAAKTAVNNVKHGDDEMGSPESSRRQSIQVWGGANKVFIKAPACAIYEHGSSPTSSFSSFEALL
jgi:hypothetical protein